MLSASRWKWSERLQNRKRKFSCPLFEKKLTLLIVFCDDPSQLLAVDRATIVSTRMFNAFERYDTVRCLRKMHPKLFICVRLRCPSCRELGHGRRGQRFDSEDTQLVFSNLAISCAAPWYRTRELLVLSQCTNRYAWPNGDCMHLSCQIDTKSSPIQACWLGLSRNQSILLPGNSHFLDLCDQMRKLTLFG